MIRVYQQLAILLPVSRSYLQPCYYQKGLCSSCPAWSFPSSGFHHWMEWPFRHYEIALSL